MGSKTRTVLGTFRNIETRFSKDRLATRFSGKLLKHVITLLWFFVVEMQGVLIVKLNFYGKLNNHLWPVHKKMAVKKHITLCAVPGMQWIAFWHIDITT